MERPEGSNEYPPSSSSLPEPTPAAGPKTEEPRKQPEPASEPAGEPMEVEEDEEAKAKKEAEGLKSQGNTAYKARKFDEAIEFYTKAWDLYPKDVTFLTNLSGELLSR